MEDDDIDLCNECFIFWFWFLFNGFSTEYELAYTAVASLMMYNLTNRATLLSWFIIFYAPVIIIIKLINFKYQIF